MEDILEGTQVEINNGSLELHVDVRGAEDPGWAERSLDAIEGAEVQVIKEVATGRVTLSIRGADAPPRIKW